MFKKVIDPFQLKALQKRIGRELDQEELEQIIDGDSLLLALPNGDFIVENILSYGLADLMSTPGLEEIQKRESLAETKRKLKADKELRKVPKSRRHTVEPQIITKDASNDQYFDKIGQLLDTVNILDSTDELIMSLHMEGMDFRRISEALKSKEMKSRGAKPLGKSAIASRVQKILKNIEVQPRFTKSKSEVAR